MELSVIECKVKWKEPTFKEKGKNRFIAFAGKVEEQDEWQSAKFLPNVTLVLKLRPQLDTGILSRLEQRSSQHFI